MPTAQPPRPRAKGCSFLRAAFLGAALFGTADVRAAADPPAAPLSDHRPVCIRGVCFDAEVAVTAEERARGLMHRHVLAKDRGMFFVFPEEGVHRFWMKNTRIELDIIFIGADLRVVSISRRAQPCRKDPCEHYSPSGNVAYALEIPGGLADTYGFAAGDRVELRERASGR